MKEMFKGLGDFLRGLAILSLFCGAVVLLVRGLDWIFERTLPLKAMGIPALGISIPILCGVILIVLRIEEKRDRKRPVKTESSPLTENERHERDANFNRGWLCLLTGFAALAITSDWDNMRARVIVCVIVAIAAWPVTVIRKVKHRFGLCAFALLCVWLIYGGGICVWDGMTHVGRGAVLIGGDLPESQGGGDSGIPEQWDQVSQSEYRRDSLDKGVMLILFGAGAVWTLIHLWREKDKAEKEKDALEKHWEEFISNPQNLVDIHKHPEFYRDDFRKWVSENYPSRLKTWTSPPHSSN
jgi:hypothetical protein